MTMKLAELIALLKSVSRDGKNLPYVGPISSTRPTAATWLKIKITASTKLDTSSKAAIASLFPKHLEWYQDLASIFFSNTNPVTYPASIIHVKEAIESGIHPLPPFYKTFVVGAIDVIFAVDNKRLAIVKALGLQSDTDIDFLNKWYEADTADSKTFYQTYEGYTGIKTPNTIDHRYLKKDVKYIMVLWLEITSVYSVKVSIMESIVDQASTTLNEDLRQMIRTLSSLGLVGADNDVILHALNSVMG
ncbi:hypothetical protein Pfo_026428 [Paulownia fortunei]|nr:hypothetical protein Pfo_026428 [Paulownia fortunei]